jgi:tetratricopeptide (TPR) repeat protein
MRQAYLPLTAAVTYKVGAVYERVSAVAPLISPGASSQAGEREAPGNGVPAEYMTLIRAGVLHHSAGDWEQARSAFLRAHQLFPNARTWRALGMVEFDLGHYRDAFVALSRALEAGVRPLLPDQRSEVRRLIARARAAIDPNAPGSIVL